MPSAAAAAGKRKPSRSSSAIVAATASGYHLLKIDGYSRTKAFPTGKKLESRPFTLGGYRWHINYYPNGQTSKSADYISMFLILSEDVTTAVKAQCDFRFADEVEEQVPSLTSAKVNNFSSQHGWGQPKFIEREALEESKHLKNDSFTVRCDVVVINGYRQEDMPEAAPPTFLSVPSSDGLHQDLGNLLKTEQGADVVFVVGGETFAAHRCVLAARSLVFRAELFGVMKEGDTAGVVRVDDMEAQVFKALLCFAYTDSLPETTQEEDEDVMCQHLLVAADRYDMEKMKLICEEKLCKYIDVFTVANILALAEQHRCHGLKKACFNFLTSPANMRAVVASDGFEHLSKSCPSVMKELVAMSLAP